MFDRDEGGKAEEEGEASKQTEERAKQSGKEDQKRWRGLQTNPVRGKELDNTSATAVLHCVEIIHVESTKALHACYLRVGLLSNKVEPGKHSSKGANILIAESGSDWGHGGCGKGGQIRDNGNRLTNSIV